MKDNKYPKNDLKIKDFVVIGKDTAEALKPYGLLPALIPKNEFSQGLFDEMKKRFSLQSCHILFPRSSLPNPFLKTELEKCGAIVDEVAIYENSKPKKRALPNLKIDEIVFTSPSTVDNFLKDYHEIPAAWRILSKGLVTQQHLRSIGYENVEIKHG